METKKLHTSISDGAIEARAKIMWGEDPRKVREFLRQKGMAEAEALAAIEDFVQERAATIRADGVRKIWIGALMILAPIGYYYGTQRIGYWSPKGFAALIVLGAIGLAQITNGLSMALRPRRVKGDLANGGG